MFWQAISKNPEKKLPFSPHLLLLVSCFSPLLVAFNFCSKNNWKESEYKVEKWSM